MGHIPVLAIPIPELITANRRGLHFSTRNPSLYYDRVEQWAAIKTKGMCNYLCVGSETRKVEERGNETACAQYYDVNVHRKIINTQS